MQMPLEQKCRTAPQCAHCTTDARAVRTLILYAPCRRREDRPHHKGKVGAEAIVRWPDRRGAHRGPEAVPAVDQLWWNRGRPLSVSGRDAFEDDLCRRPRVGRHPLRVGRPADAPGLIAKSPAGALSTGCHAGGARRTDTHGGSSSPACSFRRSSAGISRARRVGCRSHNPGLAHGIGSMTASDYATAVPLAFMVNAAPLTAGSLGVGEAAFDQLCRWIEPVTTGTAYAYRAVSTVVFLVVSYLLSRTGRSSVRRPRHATARGCGASPGRH